MSRVVYGSASPWVRVGIVIVTVIADSPMLRAALLHNPTGRETGRRLVGCFEYGREVFDGAHQYHRTRACLSAHEVAVREDEAVGQPYFDDWGCVGKWVGG